MIELPTKLSGPEYKSTTTKAMRLFIRKILQRFNEPVYLEAGSGHGYTVVALNEHFTHAHAVEPNQGRINDLRQLAIANHCIDKITLHQCMFDEISAN